jgi:hypothetical protein
LDGSEVVPLVQSGDNFKATLDDILALATDADDQTAAEVPFTPAGTIAASTVQAAIEEVDAEKVPVSGTASSAQVVVQAGTTTHVPLTTQGMAAQTGNLFNAKDSTGAVVTSVLAGGDLRVGAAAGAAKAFDISNGSWYVTAVPYIRPVATGGVAFDIMSKGGAGDVWFDACSNDVAADSSNYETLKMFKAANNNAYITTTAAGTGQVRQLSLQTTGGKLSVGTTANFGSLFNVHGSMTVGSSYTGTAAPTNGAIIQGPVGIATTVTSAGWLTVEVPTGGSATGLLLRSSGIAVGDNPMLDFGINNSGSTIVTARIKQEYGAANDIGLSFHTYSSGGGGGLQERVRIDKDGLVGLGVTAPASRLHFVEAGNVQFGTTTGTKIGTGTTQKIGFWNATPVVQPTAVIDATDATTVITQLNALLSRLRTVGVIAT